MKISVIVPAFNRGDFIGSALRSLLRQRDAADLDIIVIDDGSTDNTADVVNEFIARESCIRLIRQKNRGISCARNIGLGNIPADTRLVTFLDSDDVSAANHFATVISPFRNDPDLALTYSLITATDSIDEETLLPPPGALTCTLRSVHLAAAVFRKSAIENLGLFDENLRQAEDWDFLLRFFERPQKYLLLDNVSNIYRRHPGNTTKNIAELRRSLARVVLNCVKKRRLDPTTGEIPKFFDFKPLTEARYAPLR